MISGIYEPFAVFYQLLPVNGAFPRPAVQRFAEFRPVAVKIHLHAETDAVEGIDFISDERYFRPIIVLTQIWKGIGWGSIIYLGVIVSIDQELYEAVEIDGGKRMAKIRYVTWPFLKPTFAILFIMECGKIMSGGDTFDQIYVFGNTQNREVADILDTFINRVGLEQ